MLKISIIIPVFKVQGFLRECLDSILSSGYEHLEVIGVDDCSPDQSGQILAEYAASDARVRALRTPHNSGSGVARNVGLEAATGDYVWFVDSDDLVAEGSIDQIVETLNGYATSERPDVLLFDYQRLSEDGRTDDSDLPGLLRESPAPAAFTFTGWPTVARYTHTAWNKVVRRDYLTGLGLKFHPGWYQDVPWSYPLLINARHMALLNVVCYRYRQRRAGSVTRTLTDRHLEVFTQWERTWNHVGNAEKGPIRALLFNRMIWHCMQVLGNDGRVTARTRRRFFLRAADIFARWHPGTAYIKPVGGGEAAKHLLLRHRWYGGFALTRFARRMYNRLRYGHPHGRYSSRGLGSELAAGLTRWRRRFTHVGSMVHLWQRLQPLKSEVVVLATDGYGRPDGVCAALDEAVGALLPTHRRVWLTTSPREGDTAVAPGSSAAHRLLGRAKYLITDFDAAELPPKRAGSVHVRALAETPLEVIGLDRSRALGRDRTDVEQWFANADRWDHVVVPNRHAAEVVDRAFQVRASAVEYGMPRRQTSPESTERLRTALEIADGHRLVFYHPAKRPDDLPAPAFDLAALERVTPMTTVIMLDAAGVVTRSGSSGVPSQGRLPHDVGVGDLYSAADLVIGDYRGALFDRAVSGRHTVLYVPDHEAMTARGLLTTDPVALPPGPVAHNEAELSVLLEAPFEPVRHGTAFIRRYGDRSPGDAARSVVRHVFGLPQNAVTGTAVAWEQPIGRSTATPNPGTVVPDIVSTSSH